MAYITIANNTYCTTKEEIQRIALSCGFEKAVFTNQNIKGRYREGYYDCVFKGNFISFAEKLRHALKAREELNKLERV